jgi:hypothetical protein
MVCPCKQSCDFDSICAFRQTTMLARPSYTGIATPLDGDGAGKACGFARGNVRFHFGQQRSNG